MKVLIVESSYPKDFFAERLDGLVTLHLTRLLRIDAKLVYALDKPHFDKAIALAANDDYDVLHLSCHGDDKGIAVTDNDDVDWPNIASLFDKNRFQPSALVMSACCGGSDGLAEAFEGKSRMRPNIIFGSTDARDYNEYALAWTILYNKFHSEGVHRDVAQEALKEIHATGGSSFRYMRWDGTKKHYRNFPIAGKSYRVEEYTPKKKDK